MNIKKLKELIRDFWDGEMKPEREEGDIWFGLLLLVSIPILGLGLIFRGIKNGFKIIWRLIKE